MAASASIRNPLNKDEVLLYYLNSDKRLALEQKKDESGTRAGDEEPTPGLREGERDDDTPTQQHRDIRNPSSIGVMTHKHVLSIYGMDTNRRIGRVSPVYEPIVPKTVAETNSLAVTNDGNNTGWIYLLKYDPPRITELELRLDVVILNDPGLPVPHPETYLAAFYNKNNQTRHVIYQAADNLIHDITIQQSGDHSDFGIGDTDNAKPGTPLGVAAFINDAGKFEAYLYFSNQQGTPQRVVCKDTQWLPRTRPTLTKMDNWTQLTVTANPAKRNNNVFYVPLGGNGAIERFVDDM